MSGWATVKSGTGKLRVPMVLVVAVALVAGCTPGPSSAKASSEATNGGIAARAVPTGATAPVGADSWALADRLESPSYTADTTAALVTGLDRSGIGTFADISRSNPDRSVVGAVSPYRLLDFQAHALAVGAWAGSTFSGAEMDMAVPLPPGLSGEPTTSQLLAGYVAAARSPGGELSRALMAGQNLTDPPALRFPAVVLVLFASDLATDGGRVAATAAGQPPYTDRGDAHADVAYAQHVADGVCSSTANWISAMINGFFDSLKAATPDNLPGAIVVAIWNWVVAKAQMFTEHLIGAVTDSVLGTVRSIAAAIADVAEQAASLLPYAVKVVAAGVSGGATFVLGPDPLPGTFTATVTAGDLPDWPGVLADCANVARIKLPNFHSVGVPLTWGPLDAPANPLLTMAGPARIAAVTDGNGRSTLAFQTAPDPGDSGGEQQNQVDAMPVTVHRSELDDARKRLTQALLGAIPGLLRPFVAVCSHPIWTACKVGSTAFSTPAAAGRRSSSITARHSRPRRRPVRPRPAAGSGQARTPEPRRARSPRRSPPPQRRFTM